MRAFLFSLLCLCGYSTFAQPQPWHNDLSVRLIKRLPTQDGHTVVWQAQVKNWARFPVSQVHYAWYLDGVEVGKGRINMPPGYTVYVLLPLPRTVERHELRFVLDDLNAVTEFEEGNNALSVSTDALPVGFYVDQIVYNYFHQHQHRLAGAGSNNFDDFAQRQIRLWNERIAASTCPGASNGVPNYLRLDSMAVLPDNTVWWTKPRLDGDLVIGFPGTLLAGALFKDTTTTSVLNPFYYLDYVQDIMQIGLPNVYKFQVKVKLSDTLCFNNGTPNNPGDDYYTFMATVSLGDDNPERSWAALYKGQVKGTGLLGIPALLGPFYVSEGISTVQIVVVEGVCQTSLTVCPPNPCTQQPGYCRAQGRFPWHDWIHRVKIANMDSYSGKSPYTDFTSRTVRLTKGYEYKATLTTGYSWETFNERWRIWIDYNRDGAFNPQTEWALDGVLFGPGNGTVQASLTQSLHIRPDAPTGATRMRVAMKRSTEGVGPCESFGFGEVEDYTVIIEDPVQGMPDLRATNWSLQSFGFPGDVKTTDFLLLNETEAPAGPNSAAFYLSWDDSFGPEDQRVGSVLLPGVSANGAVSIAGQFTVPNTPKGNYFLFLVLDDQRQIAERNEYNNLLSTPFSVGPFTFEAADRSSDLHIFPNPASDYIAFTSQEAPYRYQILDAYGREIKSGILNTEPVMIPTDDLAGGIYVLRIWTKEGTILSGRFLVDDVNLKQR